MSSTPPDKPMQLHERVTQHKFYSEVHDTINTGDLLAWRINRINSFFSFVLVMYQKLFKVSYSHTATAMRIGDMVFAVEATPPAVRLIPLQMLGNFYLYPAGINYKRSHGEVLLKHLAKSYSVLDMFKDMIGFQTDEESLYCAEQCHAFYTDIGYFAKVVDMDEGDVISPDKVVEKVLAQNPSEPVYIRIDKGNVHAA